MLGGDKGLPVSLAGLFGTALSLYARRIRFYGLLALLGLGIQYLLDTQVVLDTGFLIGFDVVIGAFIAAAVSIGVAFDLAGKEADWSRIFTAASLRWGVVALLSLVAVLVQAVFLPYVALPPDQTLYGLLLLPFVALWGAVMMSTVVGAIEPVRSRLLLPLLALGKGLGVSTQFANLGRLMVISLLWLVPLLIESLLFTGLDARRIADAQFWADVPIDVLLIGPLQAISTVFYVDFLRRAKR